MPELLSRLDYFDIGRRYVLARAERINPREVDTEGSDINLILGASSYMANAVARQNIERINALFLDGAEDEDLDRYAWDRYGELRKGASAAVAPVELTRPTATAGAGSIPIGTKVLTLNGIEYITTSTANFTASGPESLSSSADVRAAQAGKEYQVGANMIRRFDRPSELFDPTIQVNNSEASAGGEPAETNDVFRDRVRGFFNAARRGTRLAIESGAKTVPGVVSAEAVVSLSDGVPYRFVELFIADSSGVASSTLAARTLTALAEYAAAGIYVRINTSRPVIESVSYQLTFRAGVANKRLSDEIRNATVEYINSLGVNEPLLRAELMSLLSRFKADGLIVNDGTIIVPAGDVYPAQGTTIRIRPENVTLV